MKEKHEYTCLSRDLKFETTEKLKKHVCKLNIKNPEFKQFYMKNWMLTHGCSGLFDRHQFKEIAVLHIDKCWNLICPCRELPDFYILGKSLYNENGVLHLKRKDYIKNGEIGWPALDKELK